MDTGVDGHRLTGRAEEILQIWDGSQQCVVNFSSDTNPAPSFLLSHTRSLNPTPPSAQHVSRMRARGSGTDLLTDIIIGGAEELHEDGDGAVVDDHLGVL